METLKRARKHKIIPTMRQKKAFRLISENLKGGNNKTLGEIMLEAGYTKQTSETPAHALTDRPGFQVLMKPLLKQLEEARQQAIDQMSKKIEKASYYDATNGLNVIQKQIQLLTGGATENQLVINISKEIADKNNLKDKE